MILFGKKALLKRLFHLIPIYFFAEMTDLLLFLYRLRAFLLFVALEVVAAWLVVSQNEYQGFTFLSSSNRVTGNVYSLTSLFTGYFGLRESNQDLLEENAMLKKRLLGALELPDSTDSTQAGDSTVALQQLLTPVPLRCVCEKP